jgi:O-antigen ligase
VLVVHGSMGLALLGLCWLSISSGPGVGRGTFVAAFMTALPLYLSTRAWRLPWWFTLLPALLPLSLAAVALVHWEPWNLAAAARLGYGVLLLLGATAWASSPRRRLGLGLAVLVLGLVALVCSIAGWIIAGDPLAVMRGSLDWHNQTAILLLGGYAIAICIGVLGDGRLAIAATVAASLLGTGIMLTNSRFGLALAAVPLFAALAFVAVRARRNRGLGRRALLPVMRWALSTAGVALLTLLLRSPLLFPAAVGTSNLAAGVIERGSLDASWGSRLGFWKAALAMGLDHPFAGSGLWSFAREGVCYSDRPVMWHPHSEWLYAWAQGGLLALVPLVGVLVVGVAVLVIRSIRPPLGVPSIWLEPARVGAAIALVLSVLHLTTEYDLSYLPLVGAMALYAALVAAPPMNPRHSRRRGIGTGASSAVIAALVLAVSLVALLVDPRADFFPWTGPLVNVCGGWI